MSVQTREIIVKALKKYKKASKRILAESSLDENTKGVLEDFSGEIEKLTMSLEEAIAIANRN